jgi:hypothetical protein
MKTTLFISLLIYSFTLSAVEKSQSKTVYKYKQYEKFDFDEFTIEGNNSSPGDLSIIPRYQKKFTNKLPERVNFNPEMKRSVERVL